MKFFKSTHYFLITILFLALFFWPFKFGHAVLSSPVSIIWQNLVDVIPSGNTITKTTPNGWGAGASGASSVQYIPTGYEGYVEFRMTNNAGMAGLSNGDPNPDYRDLDYAIQAGPDYGSSVVVYENAIQKATSPLLYNSSDVYRVALESGVVKYYHNGTLIYTSLVPPTYPLLFDAALYANEGKIIDAVIATGRVYSPPPSENRPPNISDVKVKNITQTGATVTWNTDKASDSQVEYCITASRCGVGSALSAGLVTSHTVNLSGLTPNTYYFIWAKSRDGKGDLAVLGYYLFKTASGATSTPVNTASPFPTRTPTPIPTPANFPIISNVRVINITRDSATVTWETDRLTDGSVYICRNFFFCKLSTIDTNLTLGHVLSVSGLRADTKYYFIILSVSSDGAAGRSIRESFRTALGLVISNVRVTSLTPTSFTIDWDTNYSSDSRLSVCRGSFFCWGSLVYSSMSVFSHSLTMLNLKPGTTYYYRAISVDNLGHVAASQYKTKILTPF